MKSKETKKAVLTINELKPGMIIAKEIVSENIVLVGRGVIVTEEVINRLKEKFVFDSIEVFSDEEGNLSIGNARKEKTIEEIEKSFKEFSSNVRDIFENINKNPLSHMKEVSDFVKKIEKEFASTRTVIKNIVMYGNGQDAIYRHSVNVAALSFILGKWLGLKDEELSNLTFAAVLHDFGKTKIDKNIVEKTNELTEGQNTQLKNHPTLAYNILKEIKDLDKSISYSVLMHHERLDGSGYPMGIKADKIFHLARIIAIADTFDNYNSNVKSKGPLDALEIVKEESFGRLDYAYCKVFLEHIVNFYIGEDVLLNNNKRCRIIQIDNNDIEHVLLLDDSGFIDLKNNKDLYIAKLL